MGDVNIHLDNPTDPATIEFTSLLSAHNLIQVVLSPTHKANHTLDVVIVKSDVTVASVNVQPPVLSDHSMINVELELRSIQHHPSTFCSRRSWRTFDYDAFECDLIQSSLVSSTPTDVHDLFNAYDVTLTSLLDVHAPRRRFRRPTRQSEPWYDAECRAAKRLMRSLERPIYRQTQSDELRAACRKQFAQQRVLFYQKARNHWSDAIASCLHDPRALCSKINKLCSPPSACQIQ